MSMHKWTIAEIAKANAEAGGKYFNRDTLRFFGQELSDFEVFQGSGRVFVFSPAHRGWDGDRLSSFAEFHPDTGRTSSVNHPSGNCWEQWSRNDVKAFIRGGCEEVKA